MTDRATQAAERIAKCLYAELDSFVIDSEQIDEWAAIIRGVYIAETAMQHRAEHLERVLAKVREECEEICHCLAAGEVQIPPKEEFLASCERFHAQVAGEVGVNENCLTLAQLVAENERLTAERDGLLGLLNGLAEEFREKERECIVKTRDAFGPDWDAFMNKATAYKDCASAVAAVLQAAKERTP